MERLLELLEVLSIDHVAEFVLNANDELNDVERVETVISEGGIEGNAGLAGGAEVVLGDGHYVLLDLVVSLEDKGVLGGINLSLPELDGTGLLVSLISTDSEGVVVETKVLEVAHLLGLDEHGGSAHVHGSLKRSDRSESES